MLNVEHRKTERGREMDMRVATAKQPERERDKNLCQIETTCELFAFCIPFHIVIKWLTDKGSFLNSYLVLFIFSTYHFLYE
jgi:hypothetical protein